MHWAFGNGESFPQLGNDEVLMHAVPQLGGWTYIFFDLKTILLAWG